MAINTFEFCDAHPSHFMNTLKTVGTIGPGGSKKLNFDAKTKKKKNSPYLYGEKIQVFSRMEGKRALQQKNEIFSSNPMANNIYKANSDEFKALKKIRQKARKSVLTLPNVPAPIPKTYTVSDMNDSDYFDNNFVKKAPKTLNNNKKPGIKNKGYEFYDRDARHLEYSLTDLSVNNASICSKCSNGQITRQDEKAHVQDVWSVLRNINKFKFRPNPRISDEEGFPKQNFVMKKSRNRKGRRLIETCRTEEVAYVANFEIHSKTSGSSSYDRVTVLSKNDLKHTTRLDKTITESQNAGESTNKQNRSKINQFKNAPNNIRATNVKNYKTTIKNNRNVQIQDFQVAIRNNQNRLLNNRTTKNKKDKDNDLNSNSAEFHEKLRESPSTIDSSNCFRKYNESSCTLKPNHIYPYDIKDTNVGSKGPFNLARITNDDAELDEMTIGMTHMVLNNSNSPLNKGVQKPKPRLVTTMPSAATMPKLTASDIKRRIAQIKFPLVVLGKDQLSSSLEVFDYDPPQFHGLNKNIWPFMLEWKKKNTYIKKNLPPAVETISHLRKLVNKPSLDKVKDKIVSNNDIVTKKRLDWKRETQFDTILPPANQKKNKQLRQFKDKMLKYFSKNNIRSDSTQQCETQMQPIKINISTDMSLIMVKEEDCDKPQKNNPMIQQKNNPVLNKIEFSDQIGNNKKPMNAVVSLDKPSKTLETFNMKLPGARLSWAKTKWTSDFIDNVIKKIRNGVYYSADERKALPILSTNTANNNTRQDLDTNNSHNTKEVSIQTSKDLEAANKVDFEQNFSQSVHSLNKIDKYDPLVIIPGFDDVPPQLQIKTLNSSQIEVQNCFTNVIVQFDVSFLDKRPSFLQDRTCSASSFIPLSGTKSNTKIFKCSTTIINAVLPAEICSAIPQLMRDVFESTTTLASSTVSQNMNISELSDTYESDVISSLNNNNFKPVEKYSCMNHYHPRSENNQLVGCPNKSWRYSSNNLSGHQISSSGCWSPPRRCMGISISPLLIKLLNGRYGYLPKKQKISKPKIKHVKQEWSSDCINLPKPCLTDIMAAITYRNYFLPNIYKSNLTNAPIDNMNTKNSNCTTLALYKGRETSGILTLGNICNVLENMWQYFRFNIHLMTPKFTSLNTVICHRDYNNITVDVTMGENTIKKKMAMTVTIKDLNTFFNSFEESNCLSDRTPRAICAIEDSQIKNISFPKNTKRKLRRFSRISILKPNKDYKPPRNIVRERLSTPLNKITSIEDFTQALGGASELCSVFDGCSGQKVLNCVREMKPWINDITPQQALLVLLLVNKKETPNLLQCRTVLIQGIAVNRITRAVELDMEIEVIERENVKIAECEGIDYIYATVANKHNLYEELSWIAKTTASDYHKPFDESSEKLLKSLLSKRKKLSPSYLRVMARYVGLGMLKTQNAC